MPRAQIKAFKAIVSHSEDKMGASRLGLPDISNFHCHHNMNMYEKHIAKDCLTHDE